MRVLMLGWEYPPLISGGLGTACKGLVTALTELGVEVLLVLPHAMQTDWTPCRPQRQECEPVGLSWSHMGSPYGAGGLHDRCGVANLRNGLELLAAADETESRVQLRLLACGIHGGYDGNLRDKIFAYAERCDSMTRHERFEVIHAHDWVTFPAAMRTARESDKPMIVHVHSTEFDRSGDSINRLVFEIERAGMEAATFVIAVSELTAGMISQHYGIDRRKIRVVHNGIELDDRQSRRRPGRGDRKTVLFLGRITKQKGPEFFISAAARVLRNLPNTRFIMVGWGDMGPAMVEKVAEMGLGKSIFFTGFLRGGNVDQAFATADVYVMPSVSEPFGLTALESIRNGTPVIMSKTCGVAEVLPRGAIKVDFWDVEQLAEHIQRLLCDPRAAEELSHVAASEAARIPWSIAASKCRRIYQQSIAGGVGGGEVQTWAGGFEMASGAMQKGMM